MLKLRRMVLSSRLSLLGKQLQPNSNQHFSSTTSQAMATEFKLKGLTSIKYNEGAKEEVEVEGIDDAKILLVHSRGTTHAVGPKCTHYGAPLKNGVIGGDGRLTCPWHGACFKLSTGDVEDAPALDPIAKFDLVEKNGAVYVKGEESLIKAGRTEPNVSCSKSGQEHVVIIGGGSGTTGAIEALRTTGFKGSITVLSRETTQPFDRTKLSKALLSDISKVAWRSPDFHKKASVDIHQEEATSVDFSSKTVHTASDNTYTYTKLILATGGDAKSLPLPGLKIGELKNVHLLRTLADTTNILSSIGDAEGKNIVVIGSSFIGMEVANALAGKKQNVTVVGMESAPTEAVFGAKVGNIFRSMLEKSGVKFIMNAQVEKATPSSQDSSAVGAVHLKDGTTLPADLVIEGVGVSPATKFLNGSKGAPPLEKDGSLRVTDRFEVASHPGVYAIGDIATYPYRNTPVRIEHWNVAQNAGRSVARSITSPSAAQKPFVPIFWSALGSQLRYCGNPQASGGWDDVIVHGETSVEKGVAFVAYFVKGEEVVAVASMGRDPVVVQCAELMRRNKMVSRGEIENGVDVLGVGL